MDPTLKKTLKAVTLELRHLLEGRYDSDGKWKPGDLEQRLAAIGVRRDRAAVPVDELGHLAEEDQQARKVVDAYLKLREEASVERPEAVAELVRETAYTWANRLLALRCMEARELIDPVILQQEAYGGRSLEHHRLAQRHPELCAGDDDGLFAVLDKVFRVQAERLPMLFDPQAPGIALRPSAAALKDCFGLLSLNPDTLRKYRIRLTEDETTSAGAKPPNPFIASDALGWAYQYWNTEEKDRVFEKVRTVKGAKISGADIVPATQLYTEDYMVKFLVQNSLGATWMGMHPESKLAENWEYYVKDADRAPVAKKPVCEITFLDPACGSGHFHLEAFDLFYAMYQEEGELTAPEEICDAIFTKNLFGIDIDPRAVQIAEAALWMKAAERAFDYKGAATNLVAATASHLKGEAWEEFLAGFESEPSVARVLRKFAQTMEHIDEIGSLARPDEDLREIIQEEHATWERQVGARKEANYLFPEMNEAAVSGQLPFHEISDDEFGDRLFYRAKAGIDAFTERSRESGDFEDQMLGSETRSGFRLVDLLSRRYDVVAANPPYMGSKNMGQRLKAFLAKHYGIAKADLYTTFLERAVEFSSSYAALVMQQNWLFLTTLAPLRHKMLTSCAFEVAAHLGPGAFDEISGHVVSPMTLVLRKCNDTEDATITVIRATSGTTGQEKACILTTSAKMRSEHIFCVKQRVIMAYPDSPFTYWLPPELSRLVDSKARLSQILAARYGLATRNDARFVRFHWEVQQRLGVNGKWRLLPKGGGYKKWWGNLFCVVEWEFDGMRPKSFMEELVGGHWSKNIRGVEYYGRPGLTYSIMANGSLGVRFLESRELFSKGANGVFPTEDREAVACLLNSRLITYLLRSLTQNLEFSTGYIERLPAPPSFRKVQCRLHEIGKKCVELKKQLVAQSAIEADFDCSTRHIRCNSLRHAFATYISHAARLAAMLHTLEAVSDEIVCTAYDVTLETVACLDSSVGALAGNLPLAKKNSILSATSQEALVNWSLGNGEVEPPVGLKDQDLTEQILRLFRENTDEPDESELGEESGDGDADDLGTVDVSFPLPAETFVESIARQIGVHPFRVATCISDGMSEDGQASEQQLEQFVADLTTTSVLLLLGHRWPKQIEAGELVPGWADPDGIICFTPQTNGSPLYERLQQGLMADEIDASDFAELMGKELDAWLATEFFKHHTKQFKKRPIAWQLQSGKFTARTSPAFACLLYYHKLDGDVLAKLRSQYVGPLRQRLETELRGILAIPADARSDRQEKRRAELDDAIHELQKFDTVLEAIARSGFGPQSLHPALRQYAIDDAMLALKARWLRRLTELIAKSPLPDWLAAADRTELHPDFRVWIADAMAHLDYFCARVGPKAPDQSKLSPAPTAADLANLITPHAKEMLEDTLELACEKWWKQFDEVVLAPDKDRIKKLKEEQKTCEEQLEADPAPSVVDIQELKYRVKEIKDNVKTLTAQIKRRTAHANTVRTRIESWQSKEPLGWGDWLAERPLFDRISSLDGHRAAPTTIAEFITQESLYAPDINDGVRVNIAPLQKAGVLAADVLAGKDINKAIADRAEWRADERRWVREGKLPQPGWWPEDGKK